MSQRYGEKGSYEPMTEQLTFFEQQKQDTKAQVQKRYQEYLQTKKQNPQDGCTDAREEASTHYEQRK